MPAGFFTGPVILELEDDGIHAIVVAPFSFTRSSGLIITVPAGFRTDGISLPTMFYSVLQMTPFTTKARRGAIVHDYLYALLHFDKDEADLILREAIMVDGLDTWRADIVYEGVHVGGQSSWSADQLVAAARDGALTPALEQPTKPGTGELNAS